MTGLYVQILVQTSNKAFNYVLLENKARCSTVAPHSVFCLSSFIDKRISNTRTCSAVVKVFSSLLSVSYVALLICFPSHTYECIIKGSKIGQRQPVSLFPILLKHLTCQFLHYVTSLLLLVHCFFISGGQRWILESRFSASLMNMFLLISTWSQTSISSISLASLLFVC